MCPGAHRAQILPGRVEPGATYTVLDVDGPGAVTHIWFAVADNEPMALNRVVLRMYSYGEAVPQR